MGKYVQQDFNVDLVNVEDTVILWFSFDVANIYGITTMIST